MWRNVLLIDNWSKVDETYCFGWGWYMSNDFQMFLMALLPLGLFPKRPLLAKSLLLLLILANLVTHTVFNVVNGTTLYFYGLPNAGSEKARSIYFKLPYRWGVYYLGTLFGLYYLEFKNYLT